jgi:tetratricopeptide (TPR) repeat protein
MALEIAVRFGKPPQQSDIEAELQSVEGMRPNGSRGFRWESDEIEGFFTIDYVEPAKQRKKKPKADGLDIRVPWGGATEEITFLIQVLETLAAKGWDVSVTSPSLQGELKDSFLPIESAWHSANVEALIGFANQDEMSIRHRRERFEDDDPARVEVLDATRMSVESDQRDIYQGNCAMRVAQAFQRCGEHKLAVVTAHRVVQLLPDESFAHILLGISFGALGDSETAIKCYHKAIDVNPEGQNVDYAKAMIESLGG